MNATAIEREDAHEARARALTSDREETKYVVHPLALPGFLRDVTRELRMHRYTGKDKKLLPEAEHFSTTVYYDTALRTLYHAARCDPLQNAKLRAREYYDVHSSLAELSTSTEQFVRSSPFVFLELKRRRGARTYKHRVRVAKLDMPTCIATLASPSSMDASEADEASDRAAIRAFCSELGAPLEPSCVVIYRRLAFEDARAELRLTLDVDVSFYAPPPALFGGSEALLRERFGTPRGVAHGCLVEVKRRSEVPDWLSVSLEAAGARKESFSKFLLASEAVHGPC